MRRGNPRLVRRRAPGAPSPVLSKSPRRRINSATAAFLALASLSLALSILGALWAGGIVASRDAETSATPDDSRGRALARPGGVSRVRPSRGRWEEGSQYGDASPATEADALAGRRWGGGTSSLAERCEAEFDRVNANRTRGLTEESLDRSRAWIGNTERLRDAVSRPLSEGRPIEVAVFGGSITLAHGVTRAQERRYSSKLEEWMNDAYPVAAKKSGGSIGEKMGSREENQRHRVFNLGTHGADICALSKRINLVLGDLVREGARPSLYVLEFGVNDYQGQDDIKHLDHKTDVFFDGFQELALCAEAVVNKLVRLDPPPAVLFLEFRTGIYERKTAQLLHMGVAQQYEIPLVSYTEAMFPEFWRLVSMLDASDSFSAAAGDPILPYPYGCSTCRKEDIIDSFRKHGCKSICVIMARNGIKCDESQTPVGREPCFVPMFAHDLVHPSRVGHEIARDLIVHTITSASRDLCLGKPIQPHVLPKSGWLGSPGLLEARGDFIMVNDTMTMYSHRDKLVPQKHTSGWSYYSDRKGVNFKPGWITTNTTGGEVIEFGVDLPKYECYSIYVAVLRSYVGMGTFSITVVDHATKKSKTIDADGLWKAKISVWSDIQVTKDDENVCTGKCTVRIKSNPETDGRGGNKVKILTLSARKCATSK